MTDFCFICAGSGKLKLVYTDKTMHGNFIRVKEEEVTCHGCDGKGVSSK